jgi:hypothetical protein
MGEERLTGSMKANQKRDDSFLREWTISEEDRAKYTSQPWNGEYRWFRSPNVVCLEQYRAKSRTIQRRKDCRDCR